MHNASPASTSVHGSFYPLRRPPVLAGTPNGPSKQLDGGDETCPIRKLCKNCVGGSNNVRMPLAYCMDCHGARTKVPSMGLGSWLLALAVAGKRGPCGQPSSGTKRSRVDSYRTFFIHTCTRFTHLFHASIQSDIGATQTSQSSSFSRRSVRDPLYWSGFHSLLSWLGTRVRVSPHPFRLVNS